jgi:RNA polymerase subunit RPABC4/transcription elongation factor Spt4
MLDSLFGDLNVQIEGFLESEAFQIGVQALLIGVLMVWLACAFWAYRDMRLRTASAVWPYIAAAWVIILTPLLFLFGLLIYRIVRPKETIGEVNERALAEEAMLAEVQSRPHCANCMRPVHDEWIICPTCRNRLRRVCPNCEHLVELDWTLCAWCGKDFERAESAGTAYMPSARRQYTTPAPPVPTPARPSAPMPSRPTAAAGTPAGVPPATGPVAPMPPGAAPRSRASYSAQPASPSPQPATGER